MNRILPLVLPAMLLGGCLAAPDQTTAESEQDLKPSPDIRPDGHQGGTVHTWAGGKTGGALIKYHGGPIITGTVNVYYIWYGNWTGNTATAILGNFASSVGGSPYYLINAKYYDGSGQTVSGAVQLAGSATVGYPYGTSLTDAQIFQVVDDAITSNSLPEDTNGVYFVLTSGDVTASSGFCTQYCGWHWYGIDSFGSEIRYSFVGNPDRCPSACEAQTSVSPNGNPGADGMASIIAHELEEANTDPRGTAWYDSRGYENADKCAWTFGTTYTTANGAKANMSLGGHDYLIQRNWKLDTQSCGLR